MSPQAVRADGRRGPDRAFALLAVAVLGVAAVAAAAVAGRAALAPAAEVLHASAPVIEPLDSPEPTAPGATATPIAPPVNPIAQGAPAGWMRVPKPPMPEGPRRVGIQAGHWETELAPPELGRILQQTGAQWGGVNERVLNWQIAHRIAAILRERGIAVDILPTTVPPGYLADAFVSLHGDSDGEGAKSGFKLAHSTRRTPYEDDLQRLITESYGAATGLAYDAAGITSAMRGYYAHSWTRIRYSTSPFTPSVIIELGFVSHDHDRHLMMNEQDRLAAGIAEGILRFLEETTREELFGRDLLVPNRGFPTPSPSPRV